MPDFDVKTFGRKPDDLVKLDPFRWITNIHWGDSISAMVIKTTLDNFQIPTIDAVFPFGTENLLGNPHTTNVQKGTPAQSVKAFTLIARNQTGGGEGNFKVDTISVLWLKNLSQYKVTSGPDKGKFKFRVPLPAIGKSIPNTSGDQYIVWDTTFGSYENNAAHPYLGGDARNPPFGVIFFPAPFATAGEAEAFAALYIAPVMAVQFVAGTTGDPHIQGGKVSVDMSLYKTRVDFPVGGSNGVTPQWPTGEALFAASIGYTVTDAIIGPKTYDVLVNYPNKSIVTHEV